MVDIYFPPLHIVESPSSEYDQLTLVNLSQFCKHMCVSSHNVKVCSELCFLNIISQHMFLTCHVIIGSTTIH